MRRLAALTLVLALGRAQMASPDDHLVSPAEVDARLTEAAQARRADLARVDALLARPEARRTAAALGFRIDTIRREVAHLSDTELRDLAVRSRALDQDPTAGSPIVPSIPAWMVVLFVILVIALLVGLFYGVKAITD